MIRFSCPTCKTVLQAKPEQAGATITCPKCKGQMKLPSPQPVPARPVQAAPAPSALPPACPVALIPGSGTQTNDQSASPSSFLEKVRLKLPVFEYQISKTIKRKVDANTIFRALQEKLERCGPIWDGMLGKRDTQITFCPDGSLEIRNIDNLIWIVGRGWRDVTAHVTVKRLEDRTTIIVDVKQGFSKWYALECVLALPLLCVGIVGWLGATCWALLLAKSKITKAISMMLDQVTEEVG